ncbi:MAG: Crp/Fnr family transcriptional regulator [Bacteroidota bacterium]
MDVKELIEPCNENCSFCFLNYADILGNNYLFRSLSPHEIGLIIRNVHHQVRTYQKGDMVASSGDIYDRLFIIDKGAVVGEITDFEGKVIRIEELKAPDTVASAFIFGDDNALPVDIIATQETRMLMIPRADLLTVFRENEKVLHNYLNIMANRAQHLSKKIKLLGLHTIRGKVAHYLLEQVNRQNTMELILPNSQAELAGMFGVARPSVARVIRDLHDEGIISAKGKNVYILNKSALSEMLR